MIELVKINEFELIRYVEAAYKDDEDLLTKYHVDEYDFDGAVRETLRMIEITTEQAQEMNLYGVKIGEEKIGYLAYFTNNLYSFGININHRNKEVLCEFWEKIEELVGTKFITMLYPNNSPAIAWLKRNGMKEIDDVEDNCVTLLNFK